MTSRVYGVNRESFGNRDEDFPTWYEAVLFMQGFGTVIFCVDDQGIDGNLLARLQTPIPA